MLRRLLTLAVALGLVLGAAGLWLSRPQTLAPQAVAALTGDPVRGERVFNAGGCASCHAAPKAEGDAKLLLTGGEALASPFGTFVAPNISPDPTHGIGGWSDLDFANAMLRGVSPEGQHYYPAFPYTSYIRMQVQEIVDLKAYLDTLPAADTPSEPHQLGFPFTIRRGIGLWKLIYLSPDWVTPASDDPQILAGRTLAEGAAHCGECHTPRGAIGGLQTGNWLAGAPNPTGRGQIPPLVPPEFDWSDTDIAYYLETGFTPEFDSAGGHMANVIENMAKLMPEDRQAIAAYLKRLPGR